MFGAISYLFHAIYIYCLNTLYNTYKSSSYYLCFCIPSITRQLYAICHINETTHGTSLYNMTFYFWVFPTRAILIKWENGTYFSGLLTRRLGISEAFKSCIMWIRRRNTTKSKMERNPVNGWLRRWRCWLSPPTQHSKRGVCWTWATKKSLLSLHRSHDLGGNSHQNLPLSTTRLHFEGRVSRKIHIIP